MRGYCHILDGPMRSTILRLRVCSQVLVNFLSSDPEQKLPFWSPKDQASNGKDKITHPFRVSVRRWVSPSTSKILTVLSDEHVASLLP